MEQVRLDWAGGNMGAGMTLLYFKDGTAAGHLQAVHDLLGPFMANCPDSVTVKIQGSGLVVGTDGIAQGVWNGVAPALLQGQGPNAPYAAGVGMRIRWFSNIIHSKHTLRGSTFLVPLAASAYQNNGTIVDSTVNAMQTAVNTFVTATNGDFGIWGRPNKAKAIAGLWGGVGAGIVVDRVSWLRSRRT